VGAAAETATWRSFAGQVPAQAPDSAARLALMEMIAGIMLYACVADSDRTIFLKFFPVGSGFSWSQRKGPRPVSGEFPVVLAQSPGPEDMGKNPAPTFTPPTGFLILTSE